MKDFLDFFAEEVSSYLLSYNKNNFFVTKAQLKIRQNKY